MNTTIWCMCCVLAGAFAAYLYEQLNHASLSEDPCEAPSLEEQIAIIKQNQTRMDAHTLVVNDSANITPPFDDRLISILSAYEKVPNCRDQ